MEKMHDYMGAIYYDFPLSWLMVCIKEELVQVSFFSLSHFGFE